MRYPSCILEPLEARIAPATFTVTTTADSGLGSLRQAILDANANGVAEPDLISFAIDGAGVHTIAVLSSLPALTDLITINGSTQGGYTNAPLIFLDGAGAGAGVVGLTLGKSDTVAALGITHFSSHGIQFTAGGSTVKSSYIGVDANGLTTAGNGGSGIYSTATGLRYSIGGTGAGEGNVISGNVRYGVEINGSRVDIVGNHLGVSAEGNTAVGNALGGVLLRMVEESDIHHNIISGNGGAGIDFEYTGTNNSTLHHNVVGLNAVGTTALANSGWGIKATQAASFNQLPKLSVSTNVVSGNTLGGISFVGSGSIIANYVGLGSDGATVFANGGNGIRVIGNEISITDNVVSGNLGDGLELVSGMFLSVTGNKIGTDHTGTLARGNTGAGIRSTTSDHPSMSLDSRVPALLRVTGNLIANNTGAGIQMSGSHGLFLENSFGANGGGALQGAAGLNAPVLNSAVPVLLDVGGLGTLISGTLQNSTGFLNPTVHFYALNSAGVPDVLLGTKTIVTNGPNFSVQIDTFVGVGTKIVAAVTDTSIMNLGNNPNVPQGYTLEHTSSFSGSVTAENRLNASNATITEGNSGQSQLVFQVSLAASSSSETTVNFSTANGTATAGLDYLAQSGMLTFAPGETVKTIIVPITGDIVIEQNETLQLTLSNPTGVTLGRSAALGFILNDDTPSPASVSISDSSVKEGDDTLMNFVITLNEPQPTAVSVSYATSNLTASQETYTSNPFPYYPPYLRVQGDYDSEIGLVTFAPGETSKTVSIRVHGDLPGFSPYEGDETFKVTLTEASGAGLGDATGIGTIMESAAAPTVTINDVSLNEGHAGTKAFTFTVTRGANNAPGSVQYSTSSSTAISGIDFTAATGTVEFAKGEISKTITILVNGDTDIEENESFFVFLSDVVNGALTDAVGVGTIKNDDGIPLPVISIASATRAEGQSGSSALNFQVTLSAAWDTDVTVQFQTQDGTALAGSDYLATSGTLTIPAGQTSVTLPITTYGDLVPEFNESFLVVLSSPTEATLGSAQATGTLNTDDGLPTPIVGVGPATILEGNSSPKTMTFVVQLDHAEQAQYFVNFATVDGTALAGIDYQAQTGALVFEPGQTSKTVQITILGDTTEEAAETFTLNLTGPTNAVLGNAQATGTIENDDGASAFSTVSIASASRAEGHSGTKNLNFLVSLDHVSVTDVTVHYQTSDGTALHGSDYEGSNGTIVIPAGQTSVTLAIPTSGDTSAETNESFTVNLTSPVNAYLGTTEATGTILNDDNQPTDFAIDKKHRIATWTDADGDKVTLRVNRGILDPGQFTFIDTAEGIVLGSLDFSNVSPLPRGLHVTLAAQANASGGDGKADLGHLYAPADKVSVNVSGKLGGVHLGSSLGLGGNSIRAGVLGGDEFAALDLTTSEIHGGLKAVTVLGNWDSAQLTTTQTGMKLAGIGGIKIGGSFLGSLETPSELHVDGGSLGKLSIRGSIEGASLHSRALISARSIGKIAVTRDVENSDIVAGFNGLLEIDNAPSRISSVIVKGHWSASNLTAGVAAGDDGEFGTSDDVQFAASRSLIGLLKVGMFEASEDMDDQFLVSSLKITKIIAAGKRVSLNARGIDDLPAPGASDVRILEFV